MNAAIVGVAGLIYIVSTLQQGGNLYDIFEFGGPELVAAEDVPAFAEEAEARFAEYQSRQITETEFLATLRRLARVDLSLEPAISAWVKADPDSPMPWLTRSLYYWNIANSIADMTSANNRSPEADKELMNYLELAADDANAALQQSDAIGAAYAILLRVADYQGRLDDVEQIYSRGVAADPASLRLRLAYLEHLSPPWGLAGWKKLPPPEVWAKMSNEEKFFGPARRLDEFLATVQPDVKRFPEMRALLGYRNYLDASGRAAPPMAAEAMPSIDVSLQMGILPRYIVLKSSLFTYLDQPSKALRQLAPLTGKKSLNSRAILYGAQNLAYMKQLEKAEAEYRRAQRIDPDSPMLNLKLARFLFRERRIAESVSYLERALVLGSKDPSIHYEMGRISKDALADVRATAAQFRRAAELEPSNRQYWFDYAEAAFQVDACSAREALENYLKLCKNDAVCLTMSIPWGKAQNDSATTMLKALNQEGVCPAGGEANGK